MGYLGRPCFKRKKEKGREKVLEKEGRRERKEEKVSLGEAPGGLFVAAVNTGYPNAH